MSKQWKRPRRYVLSDSEEWRVCLLAEYGGYSYIAIAKRVFGCGNPHHRVSDTEIRRVGTILQQNSIRVRDFRNMKTNVSSSFASQLLRRPVDATPKIKIAG